jgi:predicted Rossmann fold nucleotide-binding protein DprA/Smf involved in DNA uptake
MNIAVVGNREDWTYKEVADTLDKLNVYHSDVIITGGARGVDTFAQKYAECHGNECIIIYPKTTEPIPQRYYNRNKLIAIRCDTMIAFNLKEHSGTTNTINYAKELKKPVMVVDKKEIKLYI